MADPKEKEKNKEEEKETCTKKVRKQYQTKGHQNRQLYTSWLRVKAASIYICPESETIEGLSKDRFPRTYIEIKISNFLKKCRIWRNPSSLETDALEILLFVLYVWLGNRMLHAILRAMLHHVSGP